MNVHSFHCTKRWISDVLTVAVSMQLHGFLAQFPARRYSRAMKTFVRTITTGTKAMKTSAMTTIITGITTRWPAGPGVR